MCVVAAVGGAALAGSVIQAGAAGDAANAQSQAAANANATQLQMYNQTRADQAPWRAAGGQAVNALSQFYGLGGVNGTNSKAPNFNSILQNLPGYQFQMNQGTQAVDRNLAAQGLLQSGAAGKALTQYGQGLAQNYAQQYVGGLQSLAGEGIQSNAQTGYAGMNAANQIGGNQIYSGNAQASGYAGQANAIGAGLSGLTGIYGQYNTMNQLQTLQAQNELQGAAPYWGGQADQYLQQNLPPVAPIGP